MMKKEMNFNLFGKEIRLAGTVKENEYLQAVREQFVGLGNGFKARVDVTGNKVLVSISERTDKLTSTDMCFYLNKVDAHYLGGEMSHRIVRADDHHPTATTSGSLVRRWYGRIDNAERDTCHIDRYDSVKVKAVVYNGCNTNVLRLAYYDSSVVEYLFCDGKGLEALGRKLIEASNQIEEQS